MLLLLQPNGIDFMKALRIPIHIVCYREDDQWIAHCLQFDICGNGETKHDAFMMLAEAIKIQVEQALEHNNPKNLFSPADGKYFQMFAAGKNIAKGELKMKLVPVDSVIMEEPEAREYSDGDLVLA